MLLRIKGIYIGWLRMPVAKALFGLLQLEDWPRWPETELAKGRFDERLFAYERKQDQKNGIIPRTQIIEGLSRITRRIIIIIPLRQPSPIRTRANDHI